MGHLHGVDCLEPYALVTLHFESATFERWTKKFTEHAEYKRCATHATESLATRYATDESVTHPLALQAKGGARCEGASRVD